MKVRYLLDTHTLLWALASPEHLGAEARRVIASRASTLLVSAVSAWEISIKHRSGKLPHASGIIATYRRNLQRLGVESLSVTDEHALIAGGLDWNHRDPFDRMLAAQAIAESATLITTDDAFRELGGIRLLW